MLTQPSSELCESKSGWFRYKTPNALVTPWCRADCGEILATNHRAHWYAPAGRQPDLTVRQCSGGHPAKTSRLYAGPWRIQNFVKLAPDSVQWRKEAEAPCNAPYFPRCAARPAKVQAVILLLNYLFVCKTESAVCLFNHVQSNRFVLHIF